jgi:hypothetical protein
MKIVVYPNEVYNFFGDLEVDGVDASFVSLTSIIALLGGGTCCRNARLGTLVTGLLGTGHASFGSRLADVSAGTFLGGHANAFSTKTSTFALQFLKGSKVRSLFIVVADKVEVLSFLCRSVLGTQRSIIKFHLGSSLLPWGRFLRSSLLRGSFLRSSLLGLVRLGLGSLEFDLELSVCALGFRLANDLTALGDNWTTIFLGLESENKHVRKLARLVLAGILVNTQDLGILLLP